ncbi:TonB-dependent siderophore receptor [Paraglaciecola sp.]|uniref:TonB-dependent receptor n=2 Tax=Paraglaciecola sp. TaxID=1920173 RepID=UPI003264DF3F
MNLRMTTIAAIVTLSFTQHANANDEIETIEVTGNYLSSNQSNSIKTPTPILDVPQSLSIFGAEEILQRNIVSVGQLIDYTPGVNTSQGEGHRDAVVFRGVRSTADFYLDGTRDDVQYYRALYNIDQVEILRGPNALLFGRGGTGGVLNRVTKKATTSSDFASYTASLNTFGGYRGAIDSNTSLSEDVAFRVNAMYEQLDNHRDFYDGERIGINPTLHAVLSEDTSIDVSYEYVDHQRFIDRGIPTGTNGKPNEALENIVFGDKDNNYLETEAHIFRTAVQHQFSDNLKGNFSVFYGNYDKVYSNFYAADYDQENALVTLDGYIDNTVRDNVIVTSNLVNEFVTGNIAHTLMFGAEWIHTSSDQNRFNPVFSTSDDDTEQFTVQRPIDFSGFKGVNAEGELTTAAFTDLNDDTRVTLDVYSAYIQDEIALSEHFDLVIGARFDSFDIDVFNADPDSLERRTRKDSEVSPRFGAIYKPQENVSFYASYSESFLPRSGEQFANINGDNNQLDPDTYKNSELGMKWDLESGMSLTAAIFESEQTSLSVSDTDAERFDVTESEISGVELQLTTQLTESWALNTNYSYLDGTNGSTDLTPREVPAHTFSVWNKIQITELLGVAIGATYQDESYIDNGNTAVLPSYTRVDAAVYYQVSPEMRVLLNIENLGDTQYYPNAHATHQVTVGAPLNATLSLSGKF